MCQERDSGGEQDAQLRHGDVRELLLALRFWDATVAFAVARSRFGRTLSFYRIRRGHAYDYARDHTAAHGRGDRPLGECKDALEAGLPIIRIASALFALPPGSTSYPTSTSSRSSVRTQWSA